MSAASPRLARAFADLRRAAALVAGLGIIAITLLGAADVAGRFLWSRPLLGQVELTRILLVYVAFLGLAEAERAGGHVRLRLLDPLLGERARAARDRGVEVLALLATALVTVAAAVFFWDSFRIGETMIAPIALPAWLARLGVALGFLLFTAELARRVVAWIRS